MWNETVVCWRRMNKPASDSTYWCTGHIWILKCCFLTPKNHITRRCHGNDFSSQFMICTVTCNLCSKTWPENRITVVSAGTLQVMIALFCNPEITLQYYIYILNHDIYCILNYKTWLNKKQFDRHISGFWLLRIFFKYEIYKLWRNIRNCQPKLSFNLIFSRAEGEYRVI